MSRIRQVGTILYNVYSPYPDRAATLHIICLQVTGPYALLASSLSKCVFLLTFIAMRQFGATPASYFCSNFFLASLSFISAGLHYNGVF
jgi:hypothetical protein